MRIIAQKSNTLNTDDFLKDSLTKSYIDAMSFNVAYTKDRRVVVFNSNVAGIAVMNTINNSTLGELKNYEIVLLEDVLQKLKEAPVKKDIYLNLAPIRQGILNDENIQEVTNEMNAYIKSLKTILASYSTLTINLHSVSRNLIVMMQKEITTHRIGFAVTGNDFNFIDVDYYILLSSTQDDSMIDVLHKNNKEVILYILSDYYISYLYEHYLGEKSTPELQQTFSKLGIMTNYPDIIYRVFSA